MPYDFKILENWEKIEKSQNCLDILPNIQPEEKADRNYAKADIKVFWFCPVSHGFFTFLQICSTQFPEQIFAHHLIQSPSNFNILLHFIVISYKNFKVFFVTCNINITQPSCGKVPNLNILYENYFTALVQVKKMTFQDFHLQLMVVSFTWQFFEQKGPIFRDLYHYQRCRD